METRIIFTQKDNLGNLRDKTDKAYIEKEHHPLELHLSRQNNAEIQVYIGEPDIQMTDVNIILTNNSASNILIACESNNLGIRIMTSSIISISKKLPESKFYSFNFLSSTNELAGYVSDFNSIAKDKIIEVNIKEAKAILHSVKEEIENRILHGEYNSNIIVSIISFQSAYIFRKQGYQNSDEGELLEYILKEGSLVGVYCLLMVDSFQSFSKNLSSSLLDEFTFRIVGQIDSQSSASILYSTNSYLGSRDANELGENRAILFDCKKNKLTNFIPYELPNLSWVEQLFRNNSPLS